MVLSSPTWHGTSLPLSETYKWGPLTSPVGLGTLYSYAEESALMLLSIYADNDSSNKSFAKKIYHCVPLQLSLRLAITTFH